MADRIIARSHEHNREKGSSNNPDDGEMERKSGRRFGAKRKIVEKIQRKPGRRFGAKRKIVEKIEDDGPKVRHLLLYCADGKQDEHYHLRSVLFCSQAGTFSSHPSVRICDVTF
jgi:hypothetical protein